MLPGPHGGALVDRVAKGSDRDRMERHAAGLPRLELDSEAAGDAMNIATGVFSPLDGFMGEEDLGAVLSAGRLSTGVPWTIPVVLDVSADDARRVGDDVALCQGGVPFAVLEVTDAYAYDKAPYGSRVFGTTDDRHPGVARLAAMRDHLLAGRVTVFRPLESEFARYNLRPVDTRVLFDKKGWRTVVGFQTRNVPHLGDEYVQKTALTFVDGLFINPVIGRKRAGDFKDEVMLASYEALLDHYFLRERTVMATLETEMRYAGPREAVFHAIVRKNFGCTHFVVGPDHVGVGRYYHPYAAHEIFERYPDLGIVPLFFTAFFACKRCGGVVNEKTCPHDAADRLDFSGTKFREAVLEGGAEAAELVRPEVAHAVRAFPAPFVA